MKLLTLALLVLLFTVSATAQNADYTASTGGVGPFKIGMSKAAVEKILNTKLKALKIEKDEDSYELDTLKCKYKEMDLELVFMKSYYGSDTGSKIGLHDIRSNSPLIKTKSGIANGDDKLKIFKTYNQYHMQYFPEWDDWNDNKKEVPRKAQIQLFDNESANTLIFYLYDGVVIGFGATVFEGC